MQGRLAGRRLARSVQPANARSAGSTSPGYDAPVPACHHLRLIATLSLLILPGCAIEMEKGWAEDLERSIADRSSLFQPSEALSHNSFAWGSVEMQAGDELLYGVCLDVNETLVSSTMPFRVAGHSRTESPAKR